MLRIIAPPLFQIIDVKDRRLLFLITVIIIIVSCLPLGLMQLEDSMTSLLFLLLLFTLCLSSSDQHPGCSRLFALHCETSAFKTYGKPPSLYLLHMRTEKRISDKPSLNHRQICLESSTNLHRIIGRFPCPLLIHSNDHSSPPLKESQNCSD